MKQLTTMRQQIALSHALTLRPNRPTKTTANIIVGDHTFVVKLSDDPKAGDVIPIDPRQPTSMINAVLVQHHIAALYRQHFNGMTHTSFKRTLSNLMSSAL